MIKWIKNELRRRSLYDYHKSLGMHCLIENIYPNRSNQFITMFGCNGLLPFNSIVGWFNKMLMFSLGRETILLHFFISIKKPIISSG